MLKIAASVAAAGIIAGLVMFLTASTPRAEVADTPGELLAVVSDQSCSLTGWPYYEPHCTHDKRSSDSGKSVRLIAMR
jgi:hypothetical protein